ncbi:MULTISPECIES: LysE family translocator [Rhizobium/Agrobacterium group]|uniref:LysE family translocator n=1 Tax=Rhizobium/Agrobacterium group TaxID=227290 RepID=UPI0003F1EA72|nr:MULTISPECIES: LysE family translocator [Rhizobium/Agrobacterium group]AHK01050.1 homoserine/threonine efflux protein [Agrobacterium tumefaciens LBA4213 (Ach5)]AKC06861.1 RhtB family transporter [Agrobacterium tumefaciens]AYM15767.1 RhtB family transporter [Agrobacterium tumefaciens]AYM67002.1 RhtB family transporter [Agrobacterium tumefaciens]NIB54600.1 LysE family translocator [Agrobacterium tumefaciens]
MPSFELLTAFFITTALFAYIPGPAMLYAAAQTMARGRFAGLMAVLGIHVGCYFHIVASAAGLSVLFQAVPWLYLAVKLCGALYLIWLGFSMLRSKIEGEAVNLTIEQKSARRAFIDSIIVDVLNPKTALFFLAFLPQFVDPAAAFPIWLQLLILGIAVNFIFSSADLVGVLLAGAMVGRLKRSSRVQVLARRTAGTVLMGLGVHLAFQKT